VVPQLAGRELPPPPTAAAEGGAEPWQPAAWAEEQALPGSGLQVLGGELGRQSDGAPPAAAWADSGTATATTSIPWATWTTQATANSASSTSTTSTGTTGVTETILQDPFLQHGNGEFSYDDVLDRLPTNNFRTVNEDNPLFNPAYPPVQTTRLPDFVARFDLVFGLEDATDGWGRVPPQSFFDVPDLRALRAALVSPLRAEDFVDECEKYLDPSGPDRIVVFGVLEVPLSASFGVTAEARSQTVWRLERFFSRIWYLSTDESLAGVTTMPLGFFEPYMRGRTDEFVEAYRAARVDGGHKTQSVLAAWGVYSQRNGSRITESPEPNALGYGSAEWTAVVNAAIDTRNEAEAWLSSGGGEGLGVDARPVPLEAWFHALSSHKFLISPMGTAIQCSRLAESLSMLTVPIVKRGAYRTHDDLVSLGFPIVVVAEWSDITSDALSRWWETLSPRLGPFRRDCLTSDGFWEILTTGSCQPSP